MAVVEGKAIGGLVEPQMVQEGAVVEMEPPEPTAKMLVMLLEAEEEGPLVLIPLPSYTWGEAVVVEEGITQMAIPVSEVQVAELRLFTLPKFLLRAQLKPTVTMEKRLPIIGLVQVGEVQEEPSN
ncbi:MAG: hypothetical protein H5T61_11055 [Thermoflexales bacterium]|nr:hypothetical protein [Thermoflexales bacterium]